MENHKPRKVLVIDDSPTDLALLKAYLQEMGFITLLAQDAETGMGMALGEHPDLILLDVVMPGIDGFEVCRKLKDDSRTCEIPVIFVSANEQSCDKVAGLKLGAIDYISKPYDRGELEVRINIVLKMISLQEELLALSNTDELTGLANRRYFLNVLKREILQAKIKSNDLAVMILDLDYFKSVNDSYGHLGGDMVLKQMGEILKETIYPLDLAARYGGEEFIILMPGVTSEKAVKAAERLRKIIDGRQWEVFDKQISVTTSIGIAAVDSRNLVDSKDLVEKADTALYAAKRRARNCVVSWEQVDSNEEVEEPDNRDYRELQTKVSSLARQLRSYALGMVSAFIETMSAVIQDHYIAHHAENVQTYATLIAEEMELLPELKERISTAALLHDLGKISIPASILQKTDPLTEQDWEIIRQHPIVSTKILAPIGSFDLELNVIKHHHEKFDGSGYPDGLKGREIVIGARILAVSDVYDAITSDRCYRPAQSVDCALKEILACSGTHFDPEVVEAFQRASEKHKSEWPLSAKSCLVNTV